MFDRDYARLPLPKGFQLFSRLHHRGLSKFVKLPMYRCELSRPIATTLEHVVLAPMIHEGAIATGGKAAFDEFARVLSRRARVEDYGPVGRRCRRRDR